MADQETMTISSADVGTLVVGENNVIDVKPARPKVYMFRHQHAGIVTSHVFAAPPTDDQIAPIKAECERLHGRAGWGMIYEAEFMATDADVPSFPERAPAGGGDNAASVSAPVISGAGTVTPAE